MVLHMGPPATGALLSVCIPGSSGVFPESEQREVANSLELQRRRGGTAVAVTARHENQTFTRYSAA
jgi:hypothetical protein